MDLTSDHIGKTLLKFSLPIVAAFFLQSVYGIVDLLVVGHFGGTFALAGVNMGSQIMDFVLGIATGLLVGGRVIIAQYTGNGKTEEVKDTILTMFLFIVILSLVLTVVMLLICSPVLKAMQTPKESYSEARNYYLVCMAGITFIFGYNTVSAVLNGMGDSKTPLIFVVISTVINIILDLILVGAFGKGAFGAALGTVTAQGISCFLGIMYLKRKELLPDLRTTAISINGQIVRDFLKIGIPSSYQNSILTFSLVVVIAVANTISVYAAAAVGVCAKLNVIFILPNIAINSAETVMIGQNMGAGRMDRVIGTFRTAFLITASYSALIVGLWWVFGSFLLEFFTNDPRTIALGSFAGLGVMGIGLAFPISTAVTVIVYLVPFVKGVWKKSAIKQI